MIVFSGASVTVPAADGGSRAILHPLSLELGEHRISVIGANGSGKSTLLKLVNGLLLPSTGSVTVRGLDTARRGREVRRAVGFVFTDPLSQLVMPTGREDVELSLRSRIRHADERRAAGMRVLESYGIGHLADRSIYDLSGGERQLLAIAVVTAVQPEVLVADEPTTLLDLRNEHSIRSVLRGLPQQVLFTTHNLSFAQDSDRTLVIDGGRVVFDGDPAEAVAFYQELCLR
ncbi:energy-coupling factor ABC transporter ATP-binding protein [Arthrobacter sp. TMN-37]